MLLFLFIYLSSFQIAQARGLADISEAKQLSAALNSGKSVSVTVDGRSFALGGTGAKLVDGGAETVDCRYCSLEISHPTFDGEPLDLSKGGDVDVVMSIGEICESLNFPFVVVIVSTQHSSSFEERDALKWMRSNQKISSSALRALSRKGSDSKNTVVTGIACSQQEDQAIFEYDNFLNHSMPNEGGSTGA